jgi:hypothetical protein
MPQYRKKPVVIEAIQIPFYEMEAEFLHGNPDVIFKRENGQIIEAIISTLEGTMTGNPGDWIIRGVKGEIYPCKPDIFAATYDPV